MFVGILALSLLFFGAVQGVNLYNFIKINCAFPVQFNTLSLTIKNLPYITSIEDAMDTCVKHTTCNAFYYNGQNYTLVSPFYGISPQPEKTFYIYDKSNGTNLPNAPTWLDSKLIYSIYEGNCPNLFTQYDSVCKRYISQKYCEMFPEYANATFAWAPDGVYGTCTVVSLESLIAAWS